MSQVRENAPARADVAEAQAALDREAGSRVPARPPGTPVDHVRAEAFPHPDRCAGG